MPTKAKKDPKDDGGELARLAREEYCYLTTVGRVSGKPHQIEIWFAIEAGALYMLSGGGEDSDWVKNIRKQPQVSVRVGKRTFKAPARIVTEPAEDALARRLLAAKYQEWREGRKLSEWARTALPVAVDLVKT